MWQWLLSALLGYLVELVRALWREHVASSALREAGRLEEQAEGLRNQVATRDQANKIRSELDAEKDLGAVIDSL